MSRNFSGCAVKFSILYLIRIVIPHKFHLTLKRIFVIFVCDDRDKEEKSWTSEESQNQIAAGKAKLSVVWFGSGNFGDRVCIFDAGAVAKFLVSHACAHSTGYRLLRYYSNWYSLSSKTPNRYTIVRRGRN